MKEKLASYLQQFVTEGRLHQIDRVLKNRTRYITVVLEDIFQPHNASAVLRSCECFGIQDIHIIENRNQYQVNPDVALGSSKWLTLHKYNRSANNTTTALENIKRGGYRIVAATPDVHAQPVEEFDITAGKVALMFGTEMEGLSADALRLSDESLKIPIYGFTRSFNISVAVAVIIHQMILKLRNSGCSWQLSNEENLKLKVQWLKNSLRHGDDIKRFLIDNHDIDSETQ
ncbi:MAG: RNA methyltransferase [Bacteroidales bacterium]|nr:RNA methyltransferase [Bacteroidales bacterium]